MPGPIVMLLVLLASALLIGLFEWADRRHGPTLDRILGEQLPDSSVDWAKREGR